VAEPTQPQKGLPIPDPTLLTTEALLREIGHLRDFNQAEIARLEDRLDAYERTHETKHRERATEVESSVQHLTELAAERFAGVSDRFSGIQLQLAERDSRIQESTQASKDAIAAALAAQKEAVAKSELSTKEQIAAITTQNATTVSSLESKIDNVKELITGSANVQAGQTGRGAGLDIALNRTFTLAAVVIAAISVAVAIILGTR
jgi:hypothetical protein